jgi:hypothetical protein
LLVPNNSNTTTNTISQCQMLKPPIETLQFSGDAGGDSLVRSAAPANKGPNPSD